MAEVKLSDRKKTAFIEKFYGVLGFLGFAFLCCAAVCPMFSSFPGGGLLSFLAVFALLLTGYLMQAAYCAIRGYKKAGTSESYESLEKYYDFKKAVPVLVVSSVIGIVVMKIVDRILYRAGQQSGAYYDEDSIWPIVVAAAFVLVVMLGSFVWFYPPDRLLTGRAFFVGLAVSLIAGWGYFVAGSMLSGPVMTVALFLAGYGLCVLLLYNRRAMSRTFHGTIVEFLTPEARVYNITLALILALGFLAVCGILFVICRGGAVLVRLLVISLLAGAGASSDEQYDVDPGERTASVYTNVFHNSQPTHSADYWFMLAFILIMAVIIVNVIFRRQAEFRAFLGRMKEWFLALIDSIFRPVRDFMLLKVSDDDEDDFLNYVDEEEKIQKAVIRDYSESGRQARTWREFQSGLRSCGSDEEKYRYAYSEFVRIYRSSVAASRRSDTAREIAVKYKNGRRYGYDSIDRATAEFERIAYGGGSAGEDSVSLESLCAIIKDNLDR